MDLDAESIEVRLLKNRLAMVKTEVQDWQETLESERNKVKLVMRGKAQLEAASANRKAWTAGKSVALSSAMRHAALDPRCPARVRSAVKASLANATAAALSAQGPIRKGRKMRKPGRSLVSES